MTRGKTETGTSAGNDRPAPGRAVHLSNPVNELAARSVAGGVLLLATLTLVLSLTAGQSWLSVALAYGFLARVLRLARN